MDPTAHQTIVLNGGADLQGFRQALRVLIWSSIPHEQITWSVRENSFGGQMPSAYGAAGKPIILPRCVGELVRLVVCHSDQRKYALLYDLIWRMRKPKEDEPRLYAVADDPLVRDLNQMARSVKCDIQNMRDHLLFQEVGDQALGERMIAWFEPEHFILETVAEHLIDRFTSLDWTILTPKGCLWWDRKELATGPPATQADTLEAIAMGLGWHRWCESTFNPAGADVQALHQQIPEKSWHDRPRS